VTWSTATSAFLVADDLNNEIIVKQRSEPDGNSIVWRYNATTDAFTKDSIGTSPIYGLYSRYHASPLIACAESNGRVYRNNTTSYANFTAYFQPIFGEDPFAMHHWQMVNVASETAGASVAVSVNGIGNVIGSRTLSGSGTSVYSRSSFGVPRSSPAVSNSIQLILATTTVSGSPFKLQGVELVYETLTGQRKAR
jgi:hypothetical protein